jgi:hypothetical protein
MELPVDGVVSSQRAFLGLFRKVLEIMRHRIMSIIKKKVCNSKYNTQLMENNVLTTLVYYSCTIQTWYLAERWHSDGWRVPIMHSIRVVIRGMCAVRLLKVRALLPYRPSMSVVEKSESVTLT